jgi:hypothetical protein
MEVSMLCTTSDYYIHWPKRKRHRSSGQPATTGRGQDRTRWGWVGLDWAEGVKRLSAPFSQRALARYSNGVEMNDSCRRPRPSSQCRTKTRTTMVLQEQQQERPSASSRTSIMTSRSGSSTARAATTIPLMTRDLDLARPKLPWWNIRQGGCNDGDRGGSRAASFPLMAITRTPLTLTSGAWSYVSLRCGAAWPFTAVLVAWTLRGVALIFCGVGDGLRQRSSDRVCAQEADLNVVTAWHLVVVGAGVQVHEPEEGLRDAGIPSTSVLVHSLSTWALVQGADDLGQLPGGEGV